MNELNRRGFLGAVGVGAAGGAMTPWLAASASEATSQEQREQHGPLREWTRRVLRDACGLPIRGGRLAPGEHVTTAWFLPVLRAVIAHCEGGKVTTAKYVELVGPDVIPCIAVERFGSDAYRVPIGGKIDAPYLFVGRPAAIMPVMNGSEVPGLGRVEAVGFELVDNSELCELSPPREQFEMRDGTSACPEVVALLEGDLSPHAHLVWELYGEMPAIEQPSDFYKRRESLIQAAVTRSQVTA